MTFAEVHPWWLKYVTLGMTILATAYAAFRGLKRYAAGFQIFLFLGLLYPLGKLIQMFEIGPRALRWYLSDAGFVPCTAATIAVLRFRGVNPTHEDVFIGFVLALLTEWWEMVTGPHIPKDVRFFAGDWLDVQVFVLRRTARSVPVGRGRARILVCRGRTSACRRRARSSEPRRRSGSCRRKGSRRFAQALRSASRNNAGRRRSNATQGVHLHWERTMKRKGRKAQLTAEERNFVVKGIDATIVEKREEIRRLTMLRETYEPKPESEARLDEAVKTAFTTKKAAAATKTTRGGMSAAQKAEVSRRMKKYWAQRRKAKK